jgi:hypothetical protein
MTTRQRPVTGENNLFEWSQYNQAPKERRNNIVSETVTIYGEAPSGAHEAEARWIIWKETREDNGQILREYAQDGRNDLIWIYNSIAFDPAPDLSGTPYAILLDNDIVYDGMGAGLPVANITVLDIDDTFHTLEIIYDPEDKFILSGNVLLLKNPVQLIDIAYPLKLRAIDDDGNIYEQMHAIYVNEIPGPGPTIEPGEKNFFDENLALASGAVDAIIDYTVPAGFGFRIRNIHCFGTNRGRYYVEINGFKEAEKRTYYTYYDTSFDFENIEVSEGQTIKIYAENVGSNTGCFNANLRGFLYVE